MCSFPMRSVVVVWLVHSMVMIVAVLVVLHLELSVQGFVSVLAARDEELELFAAASRQPMAEVATPRS